MKGEPMQFGVCGDARMAAFAARSGYDFAEGSVGGVLMPREPEATFRAALAALRAAELPYPVLNCFVPGDLKITGPAADLAALRAYAATALVRAEQAGVRVIVFGSGGARRIPDGFDVKAARTQLVSFCSLVAGMAHDRGVTIVVEPLNRAECNVLTSVAECAALVRDVAHPGVRLLVDAYHFLRDGDAYDDIVAHGDLLAHVHIATTPNRLPPAAEPCDFGPFFNALHKAGYDGRVSIEGKINSPERELAAAREHMAALARPQPV